MKSTDERFWQLIREREERVLNPEESEFVESYLAEHPDAAAAYGEEQEALGALRGETLNLLPKAERFDRRVIRRHTVDSTRRSLSYWTPMLVGLSIGALGLIGLLQALGGSAQPNTTRFPDGAAARRVAPAMEFPAENTTLIAR